MSMMMSSPGAENLRASESDEAPARWRALALIAFSQLLVLTLWFSASAVAPQLEELWRLSSAQTSGLTQAVQIGFVVGALALAVFGVNDAVPSRVMFGFAAAIALLANAALVTLDAGDYGMAFGLRFLTGAALAGVYPSGLKVMSGWFRTGRGMALGVLVGALTVGSAGPHLIRGVGFDWQGVVLGASALAAVGAVILVAGVRDGPFEVPAQRFSLRLVGRTVRNREFRLASYGYFGHMWELYAMWTWTASFLAASAAAGGYSSGWVSTATFFVIAVGGAGAAVAGVAADRMGRPLVAGLSMALSGSIALASPLLFGVSPWLTVPVFLVWGFAVVADSAQFSALVTEVTSPTERGTALTLQTALGFLITLITIQLIPDLAEVHSWRWAFPVLALGPAAGILAMRTLAAEGFLRPRR